MANIIKPKRSNTAAKVPTTTELISGELGVNMADQKVYINNGTAIVQVGAGKLTALQDVTITSPTTGQGLSWNGTAWVNSSAGAGSVTSVSVVSANGLAGTVATATSTPAITLSTTITGLLKGNATAISAATSGTDYSAGTSALATGIVKSTTATGALTIAVAGDFPTLNQNTTGTAGGLTGTPNISIGTLAASGVITSTVALGTAPFTLTSTTLNTNLNADLLDGNHASAFYLASNPSGYTSNTGTVTSVGGTGTVVGLTLTGTVTTTGNLTLGGTFALPTGQVTTRMIYDTFTATAAQTIFTNSVTYTSGKIEVYVNGCKMRNGTDVTVTSGTSVVFATGLAVGSLVDLVYPT